MLPTDRTGQEDAESHGRMDKDAVAAEDTAEDMDEAAETADTATETADTAAESKRPPHVGTASGLAIRKMIATPKEGPKKPKHNDQKDKMWKQDSLGQKASWQAQN